MALKTVGEFAVSGRVDVVERLMCVPGPGINGPVLRQQAGIVVPMPACAPCPFVRAVDFPERGGVGAEHYG